MNTTKPKLFVFVGMPGAGKSSCVDYLADKNMPKLYFGGITVDEVKNRGLPVNEANERIVREELRAKEGKEAYAKRIAAKINDLAASGHDQIVIDGLYSWSEYKYFKGHYGDNAIIIAIAAPRAIRHQRLAKRPIRPLNDADVTAREYAEIENLEKGGPIANADYTLVNDRTVDILLASLDKILAQL